MLVTFTLIVILLGQLLVFSPLEAEDFQVLVRKLVDQIIY